MTLIIDVSEPMHLSHGVVAGNLVIRRQRSEMLVPMSDVEFSLEIPTEAQAGPVMRKVSVHSGNSCRDCGGMMQRTGTCETCTSCGTTGGCG